MKEKEIPIRILLAEDDSNLGFVVQDNLKKSGFDVTLCLDGEMALKKFADNTYDICILDVMMPKKSGFDVARVIREMDKGIPIVFLTAKAMQEDKIKGFMLGADDYITKPFDSEELTYRLEAILRRGNIIAKEKEDVADSYRLGGYLLDMKNHVLRFGEDEKKLTKKETRVLAFLCKNKDTVVPREKMLNSIWGKDDYFSGRSMDVFISKLRKYLTQDPRIRINNIHGIGFKLEVGE